MEEKRKKERRETRVKVIGFGALAVCAGGVILEREVRNAAEYCEDMELALDLLRRRGGVGPDECVIYLEEAVGVLCSPEEHSTPVGKVRRRDRLRLERGSPAAADGAPEAAAAALFGQSSRGDGGHRVSGDRDGAAGGLEAPGGGGRPEAGPVGGGGEIPPGPGGGGAAGLPPLRWPGPPHGGREGVLLPLPGGDAP